MPSAEFRRIAAVTQTELASELRRINHADGGDGLADTGPQEQSLGGAVHPSLGHDLHGWATKDGEEATTQLALTDAGRHGDLGDRQVAVAVTLNVVQGQPHDVIVVARGLRDGSRTGRRQASTDHPPEHLLITPPHPRIAFA